MITFEQARQIAIAQLSGNFQPEANFRVKPYGAESDTEYLLLWDVDDKFLAPGDGPYPIVNKTTGAYREESGPGYSFPNSTPVGNWPAPVEAFDGPIDENLTLEELEEA